VVLHSAYYTYLTQDADFESQMQGILKLHSTLLKLILDKQLVPELKIDPMNTNPIIFEEVYQRLSVRYMVGLSTPSLI
jgi:hypothetical protein